jgi:hypothetical protein
MTQAFSRIAGGARAGGGPGLLVARPPRARGLNPAVALPLGGEPWAAGLATLSIHGDRLGGGGQGSGHARFPIRSATDARSGELHVQRVRVPGWAPRRRARPAWALRAGVASGPQRIRHSPAAGTRASRSVQRWRSRSNCHTGGAFVLEDAESLVPVIHERGPTFRRGQARQGRHASRCHVWQTAGERLVPTTPGATTLIDTPATLGQGGYAVWSSHWLVAETHVDDGSVSAVTSRTSSRPASSAATASGCA